MATQQINNNWQQDKSTTNGNQANLTTNGNQQINNKWQPLQHQITTNLHMAIRQINNK